MHLDKFESIYEKLLQIILDESGYSQMLKDKKDLENENRLENIKELLNAMKEFDNLESFLEHVSLATSIDQNWDGQKVNLMTMHSSKGLEFDVVFLPGWEEGVFPSQRTIDESGAVGLEEERRLAYVGITRARHRLFISFASSRRIHGHWQAAIPSRFFQELPPENIVEDMTQGMSSGSGFGSSMTTVVCLRFKGLLPGERAERLLDFAVLGSSSSFFSSSTFG